MQAFSLAWLVLEISGGSFIQLGSMAFLLFGGVAADRFDRRTLLMGSYLLLGGAFAAVATLSVLDLVQLWHAYLASSTMGAARAFLNPARMALVRDLVQPRDVMNAVALTLGSPPWPW